MARVNYYDIQNEIKEILELDQTLAGINIQIEEPTRFQHGGYVIIHLDRREAPDEDQFIDAGQSTRFDVFFNVVCIQTSMSSLASAMRARDDLMGKVEVALMKVRDLNNKASVQWLGGGPFESGQIEGMKGSAAQGTIEMLVKVTGTTT